MGLERGSLLSRYKPARGHRFPPNRAPDASRRQFNCIALRVRKLGASMKKTFPLTAAGKDDARVRDKIRHEINKYLRRERQKKLPEGSTMWAFDCKIGRDPTTAESVPLKEIGTAVDSIAQSGATEVHVEILARPSIRGTTR